jgi:hypothetical protein
MRSSRKFAPLFAAVVFLTAAEAHAARVDMKDPRRALGREDDIRVDAELFQDVVSGSSPLSVTYQIKNLTEAPIAVADKVTAVSYDDDSQTITLEIGAEIPATTMPHLVVIAPGTKKTFTAGGTFNMPVANNRLARVPLYFQVRVSVLRDIAPFRELITQAAEPGAKVALPEALFDPWLDANDNIFCNSIPIHWTASAGTRGLPTAEQRSPAVGTW